MIFLGIDYAQGSPFTIQRLSTLHSFSHQPSFYLPTHPHPAKEHFFSRETLQYRWYLSPLHTEQGLFPSNGYRISSAIEEATKLFLHYTRNGRYSYQALALTSTISSSHHEVLIGVQNNAISITHKARLSSIETNFALSNIPQR
ncbi:MAG: hypothetical protein HZA36_02945 [Parcubacteria group bacterium]|nr:hypothetical protein [Parcubacteria group bacterium]